MQKEIIDRNLKIGRDVSIGSNFKFGENVVIESGAIIGDNVTIDHGSIIRRGVSIGSNSFIGSNSILGERIASRIKDLSGEIDPQILEIGSDSIIRSGSIFYEGTKIGDHFQSGHNIVVREGNSIGSHVSLGDFCDVQTEVRIGNYVRCHSNDRIESLSVIDDFVWLAPMVELTNDPTPPSENLVGIHVESFAVVCAGSIIVGGSKIGKDSLVASGAIVTHDVEEYQLVAGIPARVIGDVRNIKNKFTGEPQYPWREHFSRYMPWDKIGFKKWEEQTRGGGGKFVIAGKNDIAVDVLEYLLEQKKIPKKDVKVVCNQTETGIDSWQKSLRRAARNHDVEEISLEDAEKIPDSIFLSLECAKIVKPNRFATDKLYNIHFSILPKYRGFYTSVYPILNNDKESGVTFHKIDWGIDTGDIIAKKKFPIEFTDTSHDLYFKYLKNGTILVEEMVDRILDGETFEATPQNPMEASFCSIKSIDYSNLKLDLRRTAVEVYNQWRAFYFPEYQIPEIHGRKILGAQITDKRSTQKMGTIVSESEHEFSIATIDFDLRLFTQKIIGA